MVGFEGSGGAAIYPAITGIDLRSNNRIKSDLGPTRTIQIRRNGNVVAISVGVNREMRPTVIDLHIHWSKGASKGCRGVGRVNKPASKRRILFFRLDCLCRMEMSGPGPNPQTPRMSVVSRMAGELSTESDRSLRPGSSLAEHCETAILLQWPPSVWFFFLILLDYFWGRALDSSRLHFNMAESSAY